jgi:endonuclease IV
MNDTDLKHIPKILETPKDREPQDDIENINTLLSLLKNEQKK